MNKTKRMTTCATLGALSGLLMLLEFQVPFAPAFLAVDFSDLPIILGAFLFGPMSGFIITCIKILLNLLLNGTATMFVGEFANFIVTLAYVLPASIFYKRKKTKKAALQGLVCSTLFVTAVAVFINLYINFPVYAKLLGLSLSDIIAMGSAVNPLVDDVFTFMVFSLVPFNLLKFTVISIITMISYKKLSHLFK